MAGTLILDHLQLLWAGTEATFGVGPAAAPTGTDSLRHHSLDSPLPVSRTVKIEDATGNRGMLAGIKGAFDPVALKLLVGLRGAGAAPTKGPDFGVFLKAGGFSETIGGGKVTYARSLAAAPSAWLWGAATDGSIGQGYSGIACADFGLPDLGTDQAKGEFTLQAARGSTVYALTLTGSLTAVATSITLPPSHGWVVEGCPAWVKLETSDKSKNEIVKVTAVAGNVATIVRAQGGTTASAFASGDSATAHAPAHTPANIAPIGELGGGITIDDGGGVQGRQFTKLALSVKTGVDLLEKPALEAYRDGVSIGKYGDDAATITGDMTYTAGASGVAYLHRHANEKTSLAVEMKVGTVTGNRCTVTLPTAQVSSLNAPAAADSPRKGTVIFSGYSTTGADVTIAFD